MKTFYTSSRKTGGKRFLRAWLAPERAWMIYLASATERTVGSTLFMGAKIRCAVVGLGIGRGHARAYHEHPEAELVAVADLSAEALRPWAATLGADACFTDYREMLKSRRPGLVSVALPNYLHAEVSIAAMEAGAHLVCEKPMAMNLDQARRMREAAERTGRKLAINLSYRFTPQAQALKAIAEGGGLGEPYHAYTRWTRRDGIPRFGGWFGRRELSAGGPLIDLGVHRIDLAMWLMGSPRPVTVSGCAHERVGVPLARALDKAFDVEDLATGFVRFAGGESLIFDVSWKSHQAAAESMETRVVGTQGALTHANSDAGYTFEGHWHHEVAGQSLNSRVVSPPENVESLYSQMLTCIREDLPPPVAARDGLRIQQIIDCLYLSAREGQEVEVPALEA